MPACSGLCDKNLRPFTAASAATTKTGAGERPRMNDDLSVREPGIAGMEPLEGGLSGGQTPELTMEDELALVDLRCRAADLDEYERCWNPDSHPKSPHAKEEGVTNRDGTRLVDVQRDSIRVDDVADFDLDADDLNDVDL